MARIVYSLSGQGRGHTSRVIAVSEALRRAGHEVLFCCGGTARSILEGRGERVLAVPSLRQVMEGNRVCHWRTVRTNWSALMNYRSIVDRLAGEMRDYGADLLVTDFEAFSPRAARRAGVPVLSFNHQQVLTETRYELSPRYWAAAGITFAAIRLIAPSNPAHVLITSFFFPQIKRPHNTTLVPPIIRSDVQKLAPRDGEHILVYYNQAEGADHVLESLRHTRASFIVYNFDPPDPGRYPNILFKKPSMDGFLEDLAGSRAVMCTAGFTLISEALYLGKPLLVIPNRGIFEQTLNALALERAGLGRAVLHNDTLSRKDAQGFVDEIQTYKARLPQSDLCGNSEAVACIERVLSRRRPKAHLRPALPFDLSAGGGRLSAPSFGRAVGSHS